MLNLANDIKKSSTSKSGYVKENKYIASARF
jgi:hypothetical protein